MVYLSNDENIQRGYSEYCLQILGGTRSYVIGIRSSAPSTPSLTSWYYGGRSAVRLRRISGAARRDIPRRYFRVNCRWRGRRSQTIRSGTKSSRVLETVAVDSSKAVHAIRQSVARLADMWEVPADQVSTFPPPPSLPLSPILRVRSPY